MAAAALVVITTHVNKVFWDFNNNHIIKLVWARWLGMNCDQTPEVVI